MLGATGHFDYQSISLKRRGQNFGDFLDILFALQARQINPLHQIAIDIRLDVFEGQILKLPFDLRHTKPMRQRSVDLPRLGGDFDLSVLVEILQGAHVMQAGRRA